MDKKELSKKRMNRSEKIFVKLISLLLGNTLTDAYLLLFFIVKKYYFFYNHNECSIYQLYKDYINFYY